MDNQKIGEALDNLDSIFNHSSKIKENESIKTCDNLAPEQIIFYGVPGCGKSYYIDNKLKELGIKNKEEQTKRVVFHPDYTNSDFIGQILPKVINGIVKYEFTPGPFSVILKKAYLNKNTPYALIIEEINRGNAAAIFGELFQLLDRFEVGQTETASEITYSNGWSSYCVNNDYINEFIRDKYDDKNAFIPKELFEKYQCNIGIRLPPNLSLFATMNTSDQNVFKLDNAFKRRWDLELIPNEFDFSCDDEEEQKKQLNQCNAEIGSFDFTWGAFRNAVNTLIINPENEEDASSFADKQIGTWFVKPNEDGIISSKVFANKVIEYLWDDVFSDNHEIIFNKEYKSLAQVIKDIDSENAEKIFNATFLTLINQEKENLEQLQKTNYTLTKEQLTPSIFNEYQTILNEIQQMVKTVDNTYSLSYHKHYIGVIKDGKTYGENFVHFKIKPTLNEFRFLFTLETSDTIEQELKEKFNGKVKVSIKSKNLLYCTISIALNDNMNELNNHKTELTYYMKKAHDDYFKYN